MKEQGATITKRLRSSNLELYRIVCMLMIVAHHYVVNSGLLGPDGPIVANPSWANSLFLVLFGAWGKIGINCFLMITGFFMCTSQITLRKLLKILVQVLFYNFIIFFIFFLAGYELSSLTHFIWVLSPFGSFKDDFVGCFIVFYLTIPFWNILIKNLTRRQHLLLVLLLLTCYTLVGTLPGFGITFNYISWFGIIYLISSYIRLCPNPFFEKKSLWCLLTITCLFVTCASIFILQIKGMERYFFVVDCNKLFAVLIAFSSFLWFKNLKIKNSKFINALGAGTFGVLLIHANSDAMRTWLWRDTIDVVGHYSLPLIQLVTYSFVVVLAVFIICNIIDQIRIHTLEKWFFHWYDNKVSAKADAWLHKVIQ